LPDENQKPTLQFAFGLETPDSQQIQRDIPVILVFTYPFFQRRELAYSRGDNFMAFAASSNEF
jgi:hypothetical protein